MPWIFIYLVLQACISFCSVSDNRGAPLFLPCSHKNAVAHIIWAGQEPSLDGHSPPLDVREPLTREIPVDKFGAGKRGHDERGLFTGGISRISKFSRRWDFSPEENFLAPPPKIRRRHPAGQTPPSPPPRRKNKKYRSGHQVMDFSEKTPFLKDPF